MPSSNLNDLDISDRWILDRPGPRNSVDPGRPYGILVEPERQADGRVADVATIFLTNKECLFRCLMCDLWKNTLEVRVPTGAIATQLERALKDLPDVSHIKLYNSGSFFDSQAVPRQDWRTLADLLSDFETVIVETHPRTVNESSIEFAQMLDGQLQVAMGLETVDPEVLPRLNKQMTLDNFANATELLLGAGIDVRAFILLRTPFQSEAEGLDWAKRSIDYAFSVGVECCVVIPTRAGNGAMDWLEREGHFSPPLIRSLEEVLDYGVALNRGRVFADLWDIEKFFDCGECGPRRAERMRIISLGQEGVERIACEECDV